VAGLRVSVQVTSNKLPMLAAAYPERAVREVRTAAFALEAAWKARAPVDTGAYRNSIQASMVGTTEAEVATGLEYPPYLEWGTRHMSARPSAIPAAEAVRPGFEAAVAAALKDVG
jgi:HK97 gp10 family phage protein